MDYNDLQSKLAKLNKDLGNRFDENVNSHFEVSQKKYEDGIMEISWGFTAKDDEPALRSKIEGFCQAISNLVYVKKEQLDKPAQREFLQILRGKPFLSLAVDIGNLLKHGHPLRSSYSSFKNPYLSNIRTEWEATNMPKGPTEIGTYGRTIVVADIIDGLNGTKICTLDELLNGALSEFDELRK